MTLPILIVTAFTLWALTDNGASQQALWIVAGLALVAMMVQFVADRGAHAERMLALRNEALEDAPRSDADMRDTELVTQARQALAGIESPNLLRRTWAPRPDQKLPPAHPGDLEHTSEADQATGAAPVRARPVRDNPQA